MLKISQFSAVRFNMQARNTTEPRFSGNRWAVPATAAALLGLAVMGCNKANPPNKTAPVTKVAAGVKKPNNDWLSEAKATMISFENPKKPVLEVSGKFGVLNVSSMLDDLHRATLQVELVRQLSGLNEVSKSFPDSTDFLEKAQKPLQDLFKRRQVSEKIKAAVTSEYKEHYRHGGFVPSPTVDILNQALKRNFPAETHIGFVTIGTEDYRVEVRSITLDKLKKGVKS